MNKKISMKNLYEEALSDEEKKKYPNLTKKEIDEFKILNNPKIQYSTPASAFIMKWFHEWRRKKRINELKDKMKI